MMSECGRRGASFDSGVLVWGSKVFMGLTCSSHDSRAQHVSVGVCMTVACCRKGGQGHEGKADK
jgi:hypothetical protein